MNEDNELKMEFEKVYAESPVPKLPYHMNHDTVKMAMYGAFLAGTIYANNQFINKFKKNER